MRSEIYSEPRKRAIQYSETSMMESKGRSVLDTPLEPVIGLAEGETRWRSVTVLARSDATLNSDSAIPDSWAALSPRQFGPFRAGTLLHRDKPGFVVGPVDDLGRQDDFFRQRLTLEVAHRGAGRGAAHLEHVEIDRREDCAGLDLLDGRQNAVDADHDGCPARFLQRLQGAKRHAVIGREHGVNLRIGSQEFLHRAFGVGLLIVAVAGAQNLDTRIFGDGALVAAHPFAIGRRRRGAFDDDDLFVAAERVEQIVRLPVSDLVIVGAAISG